MKISTKGRYGLRALVDLAAYAGQRPLPLAEIAGRQKISLNYLEQVFGILRKAGIVRSVKGPSGGYVLGKDAAQITVEEVLRALEGEFSIAPQEPGQEPDLVQRAIQKLVWDRIDEKVNEILTSKTLEVLASEYQSIKHESANMYYI